MRICPRYSLLAFLLFTAAVAGGEKLWRGPHRVTLSDPPTPFELQLHKSAVRYEVHAIYFEPAQYECDYLRTWNGPECLTVTGRSTDSIPIRILPTSVTGKVQLLKPLIDTPVNDNPALAAHEHVVAWVYRGQPGTSQSGQLTFANGIAYPTLAKQPSFYLSNRKRIYTDAAVPAVGIFARLIELPEVPDELVRARIEEIMASLPAQP